MNAKIKARVAILKTYMTLLGFDNPYVSARITPMYGGIAYLYKGKVDIELELLEAAVRSAPTTQVWAVEIKVGGYHKGVKCNLNANMRFPAEYVYTSTSDYLDYTLGDAEAVINRALYEKAKAEAVIPAAEFL